MMLQCTYMISYTNNSINILISVRISVNILILVQILFFQELLNDKYYVIVIKKNFITDPVKTFYTLI